jgi:hypothetical protein
MYTRHSTRTPALYTPLCILHLYVFPHCKLHSNSPYTPPPCIPNSTFTPAHRTSLYSHTPPLYTKVNSYTPVYRFTPYFPHFIHPTVYYIPLAHTPLQCTLCVTQFTHMYTPCCKVYTPNTPLITLHPRTYVNSQYAAHPLRS